MPISHKKKLMKPKPEFKLENLLDNNNKPNLLLNNTTITLMLNGNLKNPYILENILKI